MAKKSTKRKTVGLVCEETGDRHYYTTRSTAGEKLKLRKYNPRLRRYTLYVETAKSLGRNVVKPRKK